MSLVARETVQAGDTVLLEINDGSRVFALARVGELVKVRKVTFKSCSLIGARYGAVYEANAGGREGGSASASAASGITLCEDGELLPSLQLNAGSGMDNRNLVDNNKAQTLTQDDIARLRADGMEGTAIITALIENSTTFTQKTTFAQEKYIRKKQQKYVNRFRVLMPSGRALCDVLLEKHPERMCGLRSDSLAQLLTFANVRVNSSAMVFDTTGGVVVGSVLERMGVAGTLILPHEDNRSNPVLPHVEKFNLGYCRIPGAPGAAFTTGAGAAGAPGAAAEAAHMVVPVAGVAPLTVVGVTYSKLLAWAKDSLSNKSAISKALAEAGITEGLVKPLVTASRVTDAALLSAAAISTLSPPPPPKVWDAEPAPRADGAPSNVAGRKRRRPNTEASASEDAAPSTAVSATAAAAADVDMSGAAAATAGDAPEVVVAARPDAETGSAPDAAATLAAASAAGGAAAAVPASVTETFRRPGWGSSPRSGEPNMHTISAAKLSDASVQAVCYEGCDSIIISTSYQPLPLMLAALRYAKPSAAFAIFCAELEPLVDAYRKLRLLNVAVNLQLNETWYRPHQVLPNRTHPTMSMHGPSGYILSGNVVTNPYSVTKA